MRQHAVVFLDVERHQAPDRRDAVERVQEQPVVFQRTPPGLESSEFESFDAVMASRRRITPVASRASICAFTFSTPASASTSGARSEGVAP